MSHPVWVRGLKLTSFPVTSLDNVAPRVGAWIETNIILTYFDTLGVAPRVGAWIETGLVVRRSPDQNVAPRVGAWIETYFHVENITE